jgi:hypothetical protein
MTFRHRRRGLHVALIACAMSIAMLVGMAQGASAFVPCPSGGTREARVSQWSTRWPTAGANAKGVTLCQGYESPINNITSGYLQIADLNDGAKVRLQADLAPESPWPWTLEPDTVLRKRTASAWYSWLRSLEPETPWVWEAHLESINPEPTRLFSVTNATFFKDSRNEYETMVPLPFGSARITSWGAAWREAHREAAPEWPSGEAGPISRNADYEAPKKVMLIGETTLESVEVNQVARVSSFPAQYEWEYTVWERLTMPEQPEWDYAVSFTPEYPVGTSNQRTYVGVYQNKVYIFVTKVGLTNAQARNTMLEIQPGMEVIQMDGGGSTSFYSAYGALASPIGREVANVLAIYRAP